MNWIPHPTVLEGRLVRLEPLAEEHLEPLITAGKDVDIWKNMSVAGHRREELLRDLRIALLLRLDGSQYPFVVVEQEKGKVIGSTRLFDIHQQHKKLEIGHTWYSPAYWGKGYNIEAKFLLLQFCFEVLKVNRVQLKTRDTNLRSQAAIKGIGAKPEGILRKDRIMPTGEVRDTHVFSILDDEWPHVWERLLLKLQAF